MSLVQGFEFCYSWHFNILINKKYRKIMVRLLFEGGNYSRAALNAIWNCKIV